MKVFLILMAILTSQISWAQFTNKSSVLDGSGATSSGGAFTNISAAGQPGGIAESSGGGFVNQAGFLNTFFIKPGLDTDGDGLADEADQDNDNDALADTTEIGGGAFSPNTVTMVNLRDTDGDGLSDGQESVSGSDPTDPNAFLKIITLANSGGSRQVAWFARSNKTYRVLGSDNSYTIPTNVLITVAATGFATPPWYNLTNSVIDLTSTNARFYAIEVQP